MKKESSKVEEKTKKNKIKANKVEEKTKKNKIEEKTKKNKIKEELTVKVIQYNRKLDNLLKQISKSIQQCAEMENDVSFLTQRQLVSRNKMNIRVLNSAIKMVDNNKLKLWMIDDKYLEN